MMREIDRIRKEVEDMQERFGRTMCNNPQYNPNHLLRIVEKVHAEAQEDQVERLFKLIEELDPKDQSEAD